jgi:hypothetical protein
MASPPRKRRLSPEQRRALELLAGDRHGINEELLVHGHGFSRRMLAGLVRGLGAERVQMMMAGDRAVAVVRIRITAEGRRALADEDNGA